MKLDIQCYEGWLQLTNDGHLRLVTSFTKRIEWSLPAKLVEDLSITEKRFFGVDVTISTRSAKHVVTGLSRKNFELLCSKIAEFQI
jgi:hypothetical protein